MSLIAYFEKEVQKIDSLEVVPDFVELTCISIQVRPLMGSKTMTIAKRVRDCRYAKGWGPDELASRASISRTALYQIECGKTETPRAGTLRRIAEALEVPIEALLGHEELKLPANVSGASVASLGWGSADTELVRPASRLRNTRGIASRELEVQHKLQDLLESPYSDGVIRIVEELHRMLDASIPSVAD